MGRVSALDAEPLAFSQTSEWAVRDDLAGMMALLDAYVLLGGAAAGVGTGEGLSRLCRGYSCQLRIKAGSGELTMSPPPARDPQVRGRTRSRKQPAVETSQR